MAFTQVRPELARRQVKMRMRMTGEPISGNVARALMTEQMMQDRMREVEGRIEIIDDYLERIRVLVEENKALLGHLEI